MKKNLPLILAYGAINSLLLLVAANSFPLYFTLGNYRFSAVIAALISGFIWTGLVFVIQPFIEKATKAKGTASMFLVYWAANFVALWITARLAPYFGFGTSRFVWIAVLAVVADLVQYGIWKLIGKK